MPKDHIKNELIQKKLDLQNKKLQDLNTTLNEAQRLSHVGSWHWDMTTDEAEWSNEMYKIYGVTKEDFYPSNTNVTKMVLPEDLHKVKQGIGSLLQDQIFTPFEFRIKRTSGEIRTLYIVALEKGAVGTENEHVIFGVTQDITERKIAEQEIAEQNKTLIEREKRLQSLISELNESNKKLEAAKEKAEDGENYLNKIINSIGDPIFVKDDQSRLLIVNNAFCEVFGLTRDNIIGKTLGEDVAPNEREDFLKIDKQVLFSGKESINEESLTVRDGETRTISTRKTRFINSDGKMFLVGVIRDISDRKIVETKVTRALQEKELLLRELYHRTKNNMQVISSMLSIKSLYTNNEEVKTILDEAKNRILGMALVHKKLYQANDLSWIDLQDYISDLVELLRDSLLTQINNLEIVTHFESTRSNIDTAIPIGLIINELFTNAVKHGFPENQPGVIRIELRTIDDEICISVSDNGVGIPEGLDFMNSNSYGLNAVVMLSEIQLGGSITLNKENGTEFILKFKETIVADRI